MKVHNLFDGLPKELVDESFETILATKAFRMERIVSRGHGSAEDFWYDQAENEWVLVLKGRAGLLFEGDEQITEMGPGDWVLIPARRRHRVAWTEPASDTVWLAVHYPG